MDMINYFFNLVESQLKTLNIFFKRCYAPSQTKAILIMLNL